MNTRVNLRLFYSSVFFQHFAYGIIIPTLIIWQHGLGLSYTEIAFIQASGVLMVLLSEIPSSLFADKFGKKLTILLAFLVTIASFYFLTFASDFSDFLMMQIFLGLGMAFFSGTQESLLHDLMGHDRHMTKPLGKMSIIDEVATMIGLIASSLSIAVLTITTSFYLAFIATILGLIVMLLLQSRDHVQSTPEEHNPLYFRSVRNFALLAVIIFCSTMALRGEVLFQASFEQNQIDFAKLGLIYLVAKIFSIFGSAMAHRIEEKLNVLHSFLMTLTLQILAFAMLLQAHQILAVTALAIFFFSENVFRNIRDSLILNKAPKTLRATYLSTMNFSAAVFALALNPFIGFAMDQKIYYGILIIIIAKTVGSFFLISSRARQLVG